MLLIFGNHDGYPGKYVKTLEDRYNRVCPCLVSQSNDAQSNALHFQAAQALEEKLKAAGVDNEVHIYEGVGHAFINSSLEAQKRKEACGFGLHNDAAVNLAWSRFEAWFKKYLQS